VVAAAATAAPLLAVHARRADSGDDSSAGALRDRWRLSVWLGHFVGHQGAIPPLWDDGRRDQSQRSSVIREQQQQQRAVCVVKLSLSLRLKGQLPDKASLTKQRVRWSDTDRR
jgi:hypothetical protein